MVRTISVADVGANLFDILGSVHESKEAAVIDLLDLAGDARLGKLQIVAVRVILERLRASSL